MADSHTIPPNGRSRQNSAERNPHRRILARDRPHQRGDVPCGVAGCDCTFKFESAARQHRRDKHGLAE